MTEHSDIRRALRNHALKKKKSMYVNSVYINIRIHVKNTYICVCVYIHTVSNYNGGGSVAILRHCL